MKKTIQTTILLIAVMAAFCACNRNRQMWKPAQVSIGVEPNDDAPVNAGNAASTNFGQDKTLTVAHGQSIAYLKFFIPGFSRIDSAVLRIQTKEVVSPGPLSVYPVLFHEWDESTITWDQRPEIASTPLFTLAIDDPYKLYEIDLTDYVAQKSAKGDYYISLCFTAEQQDTELSFASVEDYDNLKPRFMVSGLTLQQTVPPACAPPSFTHPGILITKEQIDFVREKISLDASPWREAFAAARSSENAQSNYRPTPMDTLTFSGYYGYSKSRGYIELARDARAAFSNAQLWVLTDSSRFAEKAIEILNAWSETNKALTGGNAKLSGATACIQFCNAAELLKTSDSGWQPAEQENFAHWLRSVLWPLLRDFVPAYNGNWDALIGQGLISMGIYLDDALIFDHAVHYYLHGVGNGRMSYYVRPDGTTQETLRDQGHEQMGIGALAGFAETAWNQGLDLYSAESNRLLQGIEGTAKRVVETNCLRLPIWESMFNHYHQRLGLDMPCTEKVLNASGYRPEGYGEYRGFSTLFFYGLAKNPEIGRK